MKGTSAEGREYLESCHTEFWRKVFRAEGDYLLRHLEGSRDVLSVGCGPAIIEGALSSEGFRVTGLDVSMEALDHAPDNVRTVAGQAEDMPFPEASFDAVMFVASLQFMVDCQKAIEEAWRVLRPDGKVIVMLLNPESAFYQNRVLDPGSYVSRIRHTSLKPIKLVISRNFSVHTEYSLGVKKDEVFASQDPSEAVLYIIRGIRKDSKA